MLTGLFASRWAVVLCRARSYMWVRWVKCVNVLPQYWLWCLMFCALFWLFGHNTNTSQSSFAPWPKQSRVLVTNLKKLTYFCDKRTLKWRAQSDQMYVCSYRFAFFWSERILKGGHLKIVTHHWHFINRCNYNILATYHEATTTTTSNDRSNRQTTNDHPFWSSFFSDSRRWLWRWSECILH